MWLVMLVWLVLLVLLVYLANVASVASVASVPPRGCCATALPYNKAAAGQPTVVPP